MSGLLSSIVTIDQAFEQIAEYGSVLFDMPVCVALRGNLNQLRTVTSGFGWDLSQAIDSGMFDLMYISPVNVYIDKVVIELIERVEKAARLA